MGFYQTITRLLNKSHFYRICVARYKCRNIKRHPLKEINRVYQLAFGRKPDLDNPKDLIEKIFWMELYADLTMWTKCADKYLVRDYVKECGYESYLPQLYGKWDNPDVFSIKNLPNKFIIKTNNGCGTCIPIMDKSNADEKSIITKLKKWLEIPYGYSNSQLHYLNIPRCIIAEQLLENDKQSNMISPNSLMDYKVWCIDGKAECILIVYDRRREGYCLDLYDIHWNRMKDCLHDNNHFEFRDALIPKPECLDEVIEIAEALAKPFQEVRVDFYILNNRPYIGELTFSTGYGYFTEDYYRYLGEKIDLTKVQKAKEPNYLTIK